MELSKQLKVIDRKFAYNTGKLPGFVEGHSPWMAAVNATQQLLSNNEDLAGKYVGVLTGYKPGMFNMEPSSNQKESPTPEILLSQSSTPPLSASGSKTKAIKTIDVGSAISSGFGALQNIIGSFRNYQSPDEIAALWKPTQENTAGIGWTKMVHAKDGKLPGFVGGSVGNILGATSSGAAAGSIAGPVGTVIGSLVGFAGSTAGSIFSSNKQRENEKKVANYMWRYNNFSRDGAISTAQQIEDEKRYGNQLAQTLFNPGYKCGKLSKYNIGKDALDPTTGFTKQPHMTQTIDGTKFMPANAKVEPEEVVWDKHTGDINEYGNGKAYQKRPGDILYAYVKPEETIFPNQENPNSGIDFSKEAKLRASLNMPLEPLERDLRLWKSENSKKNGMIHAAEGWLGNAVPAFLGGIAGLGQYLDAKNSRPYYPNTYSANPYETEALTTLAGLRVNPYPIMSQLRNAEARSNRAIDIAGGLSGSQRTAARLANLNTTQRNIASTLSSIQQLNNAYRASYAQAAINAGQQARTARMSANQWDLDYYSKAHAARNRGIQTGIANMLAQIQQYQANEFKRRQFNETMDLYRADQKLRNELNQWMRNWYASQGNTTNTYSPLLPVNTKATPIQDPYAQYDPNIARQLAMLNYLGYKK